MDPELEKKKLPEFQEKLKTEGIKLDPEYFDEYTPVRFLRARKYDVDAAYTMLTNHLKWRKDNGVDHILETAPKENKNFKALDKYWPGLYAGVDKESVPVWIDRGGQIDADSLLASVPMEDIINYHIYTSEKTLRLKKEISAKLGKNCYQGVVIEDMEGFGRKHMSSACIDLFKRINAITADNYPECLKVFFCVNSPTIVSVAYKLVKSFIDPETRKKVFVLGGKFKEELLQYIEEDQILVEYGGKNSTKLKGGGPFEGKKTNGTTYHPTTSTIAAGGKLEVPVTVKTPTDIKYSFNANNDIKFGVTYTGQDGKGKAEKIVDPKSYDAGEVKGEMTAEKPGVYVFLFDNSHSWVKTRTVTYHLIVVKEEGGAKKEAKGGEKKKKKKKASK